MMTSRRRKRASHVAHTGEMRNARKIFVVKPGGKRPLGKPVDEKIDTRMDVRETGWQVVNWIHLAQDTNQWRDPVDTITNIRVPKTATNFLIS
jgi:hypothetical protein